MLLCDRKGDGINERGIVSGLRPESPDYKAITELLKTANQVILVSFTESGTFTLTYYMEVS